jgi:hypothetical protein
MDLRAAVLLLLSAVLAACSRDCTHYAPDFQTCDVYRREASFVTDLAELPLYAAIGQVPHSGDQGGASPKPRGTFVPVAGVELSRIDLAKTGRITFAAGFGPGRFVLVDTGAGTAAYPAHIWLLDASSGTLR